MQWLARGLQLHALCGRWVEGVDFDEEEGIAFLDWFVHAQGEALDCDDAFVAQSLGIGVWGKEGVDEA